MDFNNINLPNIVKGETWSGLAITISSSNDAKYQSTLTNVKMSWKNPYNVVILSLNSATSDIIINNSNPYAWALTVQKRILDIPVDFYTWAIQVTDASGNIDKNWSSGTHNVIADPHA